jgi:hypothetical protein
MQEATYNIKDKGTITITDIDETNVDLLFSRKLTFTRHEQTLRVKHNGYITVIPEFEGRIKKIVEVAQGVILYFYTASDNKKKIHIVDGPYYYSFDELVDCDILPLWASVIDFYFVDRNNDKYYCYHGAINKLMEAERFGYCNVTTVNVQYQDEVNMAMFMKKLLQQCLQQATCDLLIICSDDE